MKKTAVLFDFDGTLFFGTTEINYYAINMALADMGRAPITKEIANTTVGDKIPDACRRILGTDDPDLVQELFDGIFRYAPKAIAEHAHVEPDCVHMLQALSEHAPLAICSNAEESYLTSLLDAFGVRGCFKQIWHATPGYDKARAIPEIKRMLGVTEAIMVGDRAEDVSSGKINGCITVAMQNDFGARDAVGADYDVYSHREMEQVILSILQKREME